LQLQTIRKLRVVLERIADPPINRIDEELWQARESEPRP